MILRGDRRNIILFWCLLLIIVTAGIYFRLKGLAKWPLAVDEYYIVKSAQNILKYGLPQWDAGGYYTRGVPQQYLTSLLLWIGVEAEFACRIIPLVANILALPALYLIGKKTSGKLTAIALVFVFSFSVWEIEFARFGRMYTIFQTIFVWYLYFLYKNIIENDVKSLKWLWILSFAGIFFYEGSIFLVLMNFLPLLWDRNKNTLNLLSLNIYKKNLLKIFLCIVILLAAYIYLSFDFRTINQQNLLPANLPEGYSRKIFTGKFRLPVLLLKALPEYPVWIALFLIPFSITAYAAKSFLKSDLTSFIKAAFIIILVFSLLNLLGLVLVVSIVFILIGWIEPVSVNVRHPAASRPKITEVISERIFSKWKILPKKNTASFIAACFVNFIFWTAFALKTDGWHKFFPSQTISGAGSAVKVFLKESLNYPYFYETFVLFRGTIPLITFITFVILLTGITYIFINYYSKGSIRYRFLFFLLFFLVFLVDIINLTYFDTRYFFFLIPLIMLTALVTLANIYQALVKKDLLSKIAFSLSVIVLLMLSEDFNFSHILNIDSKETNFRTNVNRALAVHYYPRWDSRTPAEMINKESRLNDIIITNEYTSTYYLNRLDYIFREGNGVEFPGESVLNGTRERWTNAKLIYKYPDLEKIIDDNDRCIWLVINNMWALDDLNSFMKKYNKFLVMKGIDGRTFLYKIPGNSLTF